MKGIILCTLIILLSLNGCVLKSDYQKVENQRDSIQIELDNYKSMYLDLLDEKLEKEREANRKKYYSESQARQYINDYYQFYKDGKGFRDVKVRRVDNNTFTISLQEEGAGGIKFDSNLRPIPIYGHRLYDLVINNDGTYTFSVKY